MNEKKIQTLRNNLILNEIEIIFERETHCVSLSIKYEDFKRRFKIKKNQMMWYDDDFDFRMRTQWNDKKEYEKFLRCVKTLRIIEIELKDFSKDFVSSKRWNNKRNFVLKNYDVMLIIQLEMQWKDWKSKKIKDMNSSNRKIKQNNEIIETWEII